MDNTTVPQIDERIIVQLCDAINKQEVVPIIGDSLYFYKENDSSEPIPIKQYIINCLVEKFKIEKVEGISITDLAEHIELINMQNKIFRTNIPSTDIYYEIHRILRPIQDRIICHPVLEKFLDLRQFPIIISASYLPLAWNKDNNNSIAYKKDASNDIDKSRLNADTPTIYYLFGKCSMYPKSYMVTEDDFLEYMHLWHDNISRPKRLSDYLKNKVLLVLGCDYPDWIFRFFWHSVRNFSFTSSSQDIVTMETNPNLSLTKFLSRAHTQFLPNCSAFLSELIDIYEKDFHHEQRKPVNYDEDLRDIEDTPLQCDIFISYFHEDLEAATDIAEKFRSMGATVWFDKRALEPGDDFKRKIRSAINECERFVPIISQKAVNRQKSFFRQEWFWATEAARSRYPLPYICPIVVDDVDVNDINVKKSVPEELTGDHAHMMYYNSPNLCSEIKTLIRSFRKS